MNQFKIVRTSEGVWGRKVFDIKEYGSFTPKWLDAEKIQEIESKVNE